MREFKNKIILFLVFIMFIGIFLIPNVKGASDIDYTFERDIVIDIDDIEFTESNSFNFIHNYSYYTNDYIATYSFENDTVGGYPTYWDVYEGGGIVEIVNNFNGHNKVVLVDDTSGVDVAWAENSFSETSGTMEFWFYQDDGTQSSRFYVLDGSTLCFFIQMVGGVLKAWGTADVIVALNDDTWYHIRIDFECGAGGYLGLGADEFFVFVNTIQYGAFDFSIPSNQITTLRIGSGSNAGTPTLHFDSVGYSWNFTNPSDILDFSDDIVGNEPIGWISDNDVGCTTIIKDTLDSRINILQLYDIGGGGNEAKISKSLDITVNFSITLDITKSITGGGTIYYYFMENDVNIVELALIDDDLKYFDAGYHTIKASAFSANIFINVRIVFDFDSDIMDVYVDGVLEGNDLSFKNNGNSEIDGLIFFTDDTEISAFYSYIDNILIDSLYYEIGSNIIPSLVFVNFTSVDRYEFSYLAQNQLYPLYRDSDIEGWLVDEGGGGDVGIYYDWQNYYTDRTVNISATDSDNAQLEKLDIINPTSSFVNITFGCNITSYDTNGGNMILQVIDESTGFAFVEVRFIREVGVINAYYVAGGVGNVLVFGGVDIDKYYEWNIFINHELNTADYMLYENGILVSYKTHGLFKLLNYPYLLSGLVFSVVAPAGGINNIQIDYCGIYDNGTTHLEHPESYAYLIIPLGETWNIQHNNLLRINGYGTISLDTFSGYAIDTKYQTGVNYSVVSIFKEYTGVERLTNTYDRTPSYGFTSLVFFFSYDNISLSNIAVEGVKLVHGSNEHFLEYTHGVQTLVDSNYFYVDSENRLQFTLNPLTTSLDYIQATFDINDVSSDDLAISFHSNINDYSIAEFRVNFTSFINAIRLPIYTTTTRAIVTQNNTISYLTLLISDNDDDSLTGSNTLGYISHVSLIYATNIGVTIITLSLVGMMIPLIMIMIPTLAISQRAGKRLITPMFLLMSIVCVATEIIPVWLFFIIAVSTSLFIFLKKSEGVQL